MSTLAAILTLLGLLAALLGGLSTRRFSAGIPLLLDLWTAAALLRLPARDWSDLAIAGLLVAARGVMRGRLG